MRDIFTNAVIFFSQFKEMACLRVEPRDGCIIFNAMDHKDRTIFAQATVKIDDTQKLPVAFGIDRLRELLPLLKDGSLEFDFEVKEKDVCHLSDPSDEDSEVVWTKVQYVSSIMFSSKDGIFRHVLLQVSAAPKIIFNKNVNWDTEVDIDPRIPSITEFKKHANRLIGIEEGATPHIKNGALFFWIGESAYVYIEQHDKVGKQISKNALYPLGHLLNILKGIDVLDAKVFTVHFSSDTHISRWSFFNETLAGEKIDFTTYVLGKTFEQDLPLNILLKTLYEQDDIPDNVVKGDFNAGGLEEAEVNVESKPRS